MFIVLEGPDHCGKGTEAELLKQYFAENHPDKKVYFTREPGGYGLKLCEDIRKIILDPANKGKIDSITEAYLYATSRARHVSEIKKHLDAGEIVICERYYYSSLVYQGIGRGLGIYEVQKLNDLALQNLYPDLVIYLKMDLKTYLERKFKMTELDRLEQESTDFFKLVIDGYDSVFKLFPNIVTIPANQSIADVHKQVINHLSQIL